MRKVWRHTQQSEGYGSIGASRDIEDAEILTKLLYRFIRVRNENVLDFGSCDPPSNEVTDAGLAAFGASLADHEHLKSLTLLLNK